MSFGLTLLGAWSFVFQDVHFTALLFRLLSSSGQRKPTSISVVQKQSKFKFTKGMYPRPRSKVKCCCRFDRIQRVVFFFFTCRDPQDHDASRGEKWLRKVGPTCAKGRGISCSPTPRLCSVVCGGPRQAAAGSRGVRRTNAAPPLSPPPGSPQLQSNAHQGQDEDVNTRSLYRAQNFEDSPTKNAAVLLPLHSDLSGEISSKKYENTVLHIV